MRARVTGYSWHMLLIVTTSLLMRQLLLPDSNIFASGQDMTAIYLSCPEFFLSVLRSDGSMIDHPVNPFHPRAALTYGTGDLFHWTGL